MIQERIAAQTILIARDDKRIQRARGLLLSHSDHGLICTACDLHLDTVEYLSCEPIADAVLRHVDLSAVNDSFRSDDDYLRLISKYFFAFAPPVVYGLRCCQTPDMFLHAFALALLVPIPRDTP
jgi:hypothetical protein